LLYSANGQKMDSISLLRLFILWDIRLFVFALLIIIVAFLLDGRINTSGLLHGRTRAGDRYLSAERVQLLVVTLALAAQYVSEVIAGGRTFLPAVPHAWIAVLGGSHSLYLGGKFWNRNQEK
jgi:hypothetical protein